MEGVEILATQEVAIAWEFNWFAFWITFAVTFVLSGLTAIVIADEYTYGFGVFIAIIGVAIGILFGMLFGTACRDAKEYETHYKVIISDEVPMNEFIERYEIIDQEGKIFTVREVKE